MIEDPRGRGPVDRPPIADVDQLLAVLLVLGYTVPDESAASRARLLGALTAWVDLIVMFDVDRIDAEQAREGLTDVVRTGALDVLARRPFLATMVDVNTTANELLGRLIEHRLNTLRLDIEELANPNGRTGIAGAVLPFLRALCAVAPLFNRTGGHTTREQVNKAAKAALKHLGEGRQSLHYLMKQT
ncbi:hypothetical protein [Kitasatospora griseola]|uniref:hypothetical protein n=1 Tax=Kitasatospora griseola TaxID=2064 RepID=UPI00167161CD|nr:hypothetical protein [Kitasatospora griseola]GGQ94716.1 hypothetical protein GCM10010195_58240 [Kitasatospora griseola]